MVRGVPCDECRKRCKVLRHKPKEQWPLVSRFFKLMFGEEYTEVLYLPPAFARTVQHLVGQETQIEDVDGKQWSVTLSKVKGSLAFQKGWPKFYQDHDLKLGELVMFKYIKGSHFFVRIYGISACERFNFNNEIPRRNKRPRRVQLTPSEDEPIQTADVNSGGKPPSATSADVGFELQTRERNLAVITAEPMIMEDPACMIIRDDTNYQREDRNFLDLSSFEMQNGISNTSAYQKVLNFCPSSDDPEQAKTTGDNAQTGVVQESPVKGHSGNMFTDKLEKIELMDQMNRSCGILSFKTEKALETKIVPSDAEITKQVIKIGDTQKAVTHSNDHFKKPSENRNSSKCIMDDVSNSQNGTGKHAEEVHVGKSRAHESSVSSSVVKEPFGKHAIKTERVEFGGKEPAVFSINDQIFSPEVKVEPDQSYEMGPPDTISPFSAEVKSKAYLELPSEFPPLRGKRERGRGKVIYLKDSIERVLPVFYPDTAGGFKALTVNWATFCRDNNVNLGDECRFYQVEDDAHCVFRVDVIRRSPNK